MKFEGVKASAADVVGALGDGWQTLADVIDRGKVMLAAEMMGGAQKVLDMTVEYAKVRAQFGRPIGSFQAVQHKCANMMIDVEGAKSAVYYAAWAVSNEVAEAPLAAALAKAAASDAYRRVSADGIQVHGGIGFTWDHDMHLYFKRAKSSEFTFGDATYNRELVAQGYQPVGPKESVIRWRSTRVIIGKTGKPFTMPIEWSKVREFARAIRDPNPVYFNPELAKKECGGIPVPPTFLQAASFWMGEDSMPTAKFDMRRILHGEQDFEFVKPIFVGDVLTGTSRIADVYEKEGGRGGKMTFMVTEIEYKNQKGETVAFARGTLVETGQAVSG